MPPEDRSAPALSPATLTVPDYAVIGFLCGLVLTLLEATDRTLTLAPFIPSSGQQLLFLLCFSPTVLGTAALGMLIGIGVSALIRLERFETRFLSQSSAKWKYTTAKAARILLAAVAVIPVALLLRPTLRAVFRISSNKVKGPMRRSSPDAFEVVKDLTQWLQAHPYVLWGAVLIMVWAAWRWRIQRLWPRVMSLAIAKRGLLIPALLMLAAGAYAVDSRYYFSIYDRSIHLPLFAVEIGASFVAAFLLYRGLNSHRRRRISRVAITGLAVAGACFTLMIVRFESDSSLKALFWSRSVIARRWVASLQWAMDRDRDRFSPLLGGGDTNDSDPKINPLAREIPDNGIDENGLGGDLKTDVRGQMPDVSGPSTFDGLKSAVTERQRLEAGEAHPLFNPLASGHRPPASGQKPNILLITIDALRADHLGCYGYGRPTSPNLDRFAAQGQLFFHAYSQGTNTGHSFCSMLRSASGEDIFDDARPTFIELLAGQGYTTTFYNAKRSEKWLRGPTWARYRPTLSRGVQHQGHSGGLGQWSAEEITDRLIEHYGELSSTRSDFVWAHYLEPHYPYLRHPESDFGPNAIDRYDSEIAETDRALGRLFAFIEKSKSAGQLLVIITADHGEAFFEHGQREHSSRPYQEQIRVPLLMNHPGKPPRQWDEPVGLIDLGPTLLRFAGIDPPPEYGGFDLYSEIPLPDRAIFSETPRNIPEPNFYVWAMITGSWKLLFDVVGNTWELYDLRNDPGERRNLIATHPEVSREMKQKFGRWFDVQSLQPVQSGSWSIQHLLRK